MNKKLLHCGKLYDGLTDHIVDNMDILVVDEIIAEVDRNIQVSDAEVVDLSNYTVTPGMIDNHVHLNAFEWQNWYSEAICNSSSWKAMAVLFNAQKALKRGFTTLRHAGSDSNDDYGSIDAKRVIERGYFEGSRLVIAPNMLTSTGGMGDFGRRYFSNPELSIFLTDKQISCGTGKDFFIEAVRREVKMGADFIKIMGSGGFMSPTGGPGDVQFTDEELHAIIDTAHQMNTTCTAHAYTPDIISKLVKFGCDGIEHGSLMDEDTASLMEEKNVYLVPTFAQYDSIIFLDEDELAKREPKAFRDKLCAYSDQLKQGREVIKNSSIKLGFGSDYMDLHPSYEGGAREYKSWISSGMDAMRTLKAATSGNADIIRRPDLGRILPGCTADIAAWKRDLLNDPEALFECAYVMKEGKEYDTESIE